MLSIKKFRRACIELMQQYDVTIEGSAMEALRVAFIRLGVAEADVRREIEAFVEGPGGHVNREDVVSAFPIIADRYPRVDAGLTVRHRPTQASHGNQHPGHGHEMTVEIDAGGHINPDHDDDIPRPVQAAVAIPPPPPEAVAIPPPPPEQAPLRVVDDDARQDRRNGLALDDCFGEQAAAHEPQPDPPIVHVIPDAERVEPRETIQRHPYIRVVRWIYTAGREVDAELQWANSIEPSSHLSHADRVVAQRVRQYFRTNEVRRALLEAQRVEAIGRPRARAEAQRVQRNRRANERSRARRVRND